MTEKRNLSKKGAVLVAMLVVVITAAFLLISGALAKQTDTGTASGTGVTYTKDRLSYGDIWAFDYDAENSLYKTQESKTYTFYTNTNKTGNKSNTTVNGASYYLNPSTKNNEGVSGESVRTQKGKAFFSSSTQDATVQGLGGITVNTVKATATGALYTVVPNSTGTYTVYVYSANGAPSSGSVKYSVLDTGEKYNEYANADSGTAKTDISWTTIGSNWYAGTFEVANTSWGAYSVNHEGKSQVSFIDLNENIKENKIDPIKSDLVSMLLVPDINRYYNIWSTNKAWFDTLVVFQLNDVNVQLGPITKTGTLTLESDSDTSDAYTGTLTAQNVFGQTVAVGRQTNTVYAPIVLKAVPNESSQFMGVEDTSGGVATALAQDGLYRYDFESNGATVKARWGELVKLPSLRVTRTNGSGVPDTGYTCPLDFITSTNQNLSANYTDPGYIYSFSLDGLDDVSEGWTYTYKIDDGAEQAFAAGQTATLPVRFESRQIQFFAKKDGKTYTAAFAVTVNGSASTTDSSDASTVAQVGSNYYYFVEDALQAANSGTKVIVRKNATFCTPDIFTTARWGDAKNAGAGYTVKSGVTLLVPNDSDASTITDAGSKNLYEYIADLKTITPTEYRRLSLPKGVTLTVNGNLIVGGKWNAPAGGQIMKAISYGLIMMQDGSHISVESGGKLYAWGYISGTLNQDRTQVAGSVTAKSGSTLYEIFQIQDFRGGSQTNGLISNKEVFPINQYYIQNIEVPLTVHAGATETVATAMYAVSTTTATSLTLVGQNSGLFQLMGENASLLRSYNPALDRMTYTLNGETAIKSISLQLRVSVVSKTIDSADYYLPITSNMTIDVQSGNTKIESDVALLPGVEMNIAKDATTTVASDKTLFVYDADEWVNKGYAGANGKDMVSAPYSVANGTAPRRTNKDLVDASITVKGTLDAQGNVCTSASGADITVESGGTLKIGPDGIGTASIKQAKGSEDPVTISNTSAQLKNADGSYSQTAGVKAATLTKKDGDAFIKTSSDGTTEQETVKLQDSTGAIKRFYTYEAAIAAITTEDPVTLTALRNSDEKISVDFDQESFIVKNVRLLLEEYRLGGTVTNESTLTIKNGIFDGVVTNTIGSDLYINGGTFNGVIQNNEKNANLEITDGTFNGPVSNNGAKSMTIQGGIFNGTVTNGLSTSATISNGTFAKLLNRGTVTLNSGKFDEVENQGTITVTAPAAVKIKSLPITGTLVDSTGTPLTLEKTADAEGYYSLTENTATIRFNCNGTKDGKTIATGDTNEKKVHLVGSTVYAYPFTMTAENYSFKGWAKSAEATETLFAADETKNATLEAQTLKENGATVGGTLDLYAVYQKEWSYKIIWNVDGKRVQETHWTDSMKEASYTLAADVTNAITEVKVTGPEESYTMTRRNRSVTIADVKANLTVNITTGIEEGNATYYMGEMSFQYCKSMAVFTNDGWKMLDNYTWRHKTGSVTHEVGENTYTVANGDILLVNDSNQVYAYTIKLAEKGADFGWAHMEFLLDGKAVAGQDEINVVVQPGKKATVTAKMVGDTEKLDMKDQPLGKIKVEMQPAE